VGLMSRDEKTASAKRLFTRRSIKLVGYVLFRDVKPERQATVESQKFLSPGGRCLLGVCRMRIWVGGKGKRPAIIGKRNLRHIHLLWSVTCSEIAIPLGGRLDRRRATTSTRRQLANGTYARLLEPGCVQWARKIVPNRPV